MSRGSTNIARKRRFYEPSFNHNHDINRSSLEDPCTQIYALWGPVIENSPFTACLHDHSEEKPKYNMPKLSDMKECSLKKLEKQNYEVYLSAAMFPPGKGGRTKDRIAGMPAVTLDLDNHKTKKYGKVPPEEMVYVIFRICQDFSLPCPDMIIHSGGGLQLYWIFEPMRFSKRFPRTYDNRNQRELNSDRWLAVVRKLWTVFAPLGADYDGNNVVRLTRLVGSKSARNGNTVRIVHLAPHLMDPGADRGTFDQLERAVEQGIEENFDKIDHEGNEERKLSKRKKPKKSKKAPVAEGKVSDDPKSPQPVRESFQAGDNVINLQTVRELQNHCHKELIDEGFGKQAQYRLTDIFKLIEGRHNGEIPEGFRNSYIYAIASLLAFLAPPAALERRTHELAAELCGDDWTPEETQNSISNVLKRAEEAERGDTRPHPKTGEDVDPRYWYRSENLAGFLNVSFEEMQAYDLRAVINDERRAETYKENNKKKNDKRKPVETPAARKRKLRILEVHALYKDGMSIAEIVRETGRSKNTVKSYIRQEKPVLAEIHEEPEPQIAPAPEQAQEKPQKVAQKPVRKIKSPMLAKTKKANREAHMGHPIPANDHGPGIIEFKRPETPDASHSITDPAFAEISPAEKLAATGCPF